MNKIFVTGIGTAVGKTIVSAILTEALNADYWKPIQTGADEDSDAETVRNLVSNPHSRFHPECYLFAAPLSPHIAAQKENKTIELSNLKSKISQLKSKCLIIEGAGGVMVPLNKTNRIIDLILALEARPVIVSRHYLGSINHTLLTFDTLVSRGIKPLGIVYNGLDNYGAEEYIQDYTNLSVLGRINQELELTKDVVKRYAAEMKGSLETALPKGI